MLSALLLLGMLIYPFSALADYSVIQRTCERSPSQCIDKVSPLLADDNNKGRLYYKYALLELEALWTLEQRERLGERLAYWRTQKQLPAFFELSYMIISAKESVAMGNKQHGREQLSRAIALLESLNSEYQEPMMFVKIANLKLYFPEQHLDGYHMLLNVAERFGHIELPLFQQELWANLGHFAAMLSQHTDAATFRERSYHWTAQLDNVQQQAVAAYNLARSLHRLERLFEAAKYYSEAIDKGAESDSEVVANVAQLYLAVVKHEQKESQAAIRLWQGVDPRLLSPERLLEYQRLQQAFKPNKKPLK